ncbi:response regulator transcription factor [Dyella amyloliquefaciens]|uniref:response regulator transcription factor n=1 Tax=Dyella amyloliquefaciens TaxID=1770545 RepID=UPI00102E2ED4|nr:response regulator transcription factor [Dyella amyloliquefaciens]
MRIVIADDHPVVLMGLRVALQNQSSRFEVVGEATNGNELLKVLSATSCDLLITDFSMNEELEPTADSEDGLALITHIHEAHPKVPIIVLSRLNNPALVQGMLTIGVRGVVDKMSMTKELMIAINSVVSGRIYLSDHTRKQLLELASGGGRQLSAKEADVVRLFAQGLSVTEIARRTGRSVRTISQQKRDAMRKLGIAADKQLHEYARSMGLF